MASGYFLTVILLLQSGGYEERIYHGFATLEDCKSGAPYANGSSIANWGTITGDAAAIGVNPIVVCAPEQDPVVPPRVCSTEKPCSADLDGNGMVTGEDYRLFMKQYQGK